MKQYLILPILCLVISCTNDVKTNTTEAILKKPDKLVFESSDHQKLYNIIKEKDSLLFQIGFNQIDTLEVSALTANDFEFYHDEHGITDSKKAFVNNINGIRDLQFKTWRTLVGSSLEVFPLYKENKQILYGAIQNGIHNFYQQIEGQEGKTNTARFTHLWIIENGDWKLKRVLSYDHRIPNKKVLPNNN